MLKSKESSTMFISQNSKANHNLFGFDFGIKRKFYKKNIKSTKIVDNALKMC